MTIKIDTRAVISCLIKENKQLKKELDDQTELTMSLISGQHKVEKLQQKSYKFLDDDKKMAEHFRLKIPLTQGFYIRMKIEEIHNYVEENPIDGKAAARALNKIAEDIKDE